MKIIMIMNLMDPLIHIELNKLYEFNNKWLNLKSIPGDIHNVWIELSLLISKAAWLCRIAITGKILNWLFL